MTRVAIVGGGPAGLMAAILLGRTGVNCVVFERQTWPVDKVCGEGIMPNGVAALERAGVLELIDEKRSRAFRGVRYVDSGGRTAEGRFRGRSGLVVRRLALSEALFAAASEEPRVELRPGQALVGFTESPDSIRLTLKSTGEPQPFESGEFDYLIGADGLKSKVRRLAGLDGTPRSAPGKQPGRMGARIHYAIEPWDDLVQVWWQSGVECYVAPTSDGCVEFNFGWDNDVLRPREVDGKVVSLEEGLMRIFPELRARVSKAQATSEMRSWGPLPHLATEHLRGRVALLGDAGLFYDQITGEGLSLAFLQAELLAATLPGWDSPTDRTRFTKGIDKMASHYIQITDFAMFFTRHPRLRSVMIWLLARSPKLFTHMMHANMGEVPLVGPAIRYGLQGLWRPAR
jgi:2-polyprenyl-6-methoxyphenol hydroxylase-like FAD-dependent oxidoreductase